MSRFDVDRSDLAAVLSGSKICSGAIVCVIEAETRRARPERDPPPAPGRNKWRAFFGGSIHIYRNLLTVPVQLLRSVRVIVNIDGDLPPFFETKQGARKLSIR